MISSYSSNVILSKAKAMFGKRLTTKDYNDLINCNSVQEVASFLKNQTNYHDILKSINEADIHRARLESLLKQKLFQNFASLGRYELSTGNRFDKYIISTFEIEQIIKSLTFLSASKTDEYLYSMPLFFNKHTHIDMIALSQSKNYDDFLLAIEHSSYYDILKNFKPQKNEQINIPVIENTLYTYLYEIMFNIIEHHSNKSTKDELKNIMNLDIDIENFIRIVRLKKYYNSPEHYIRLSMLPFGRIKRKTISEMIEAPTIEEVFNIMKKTNSGKKIKNIKYNYIDQIRGKILYSISRKNIRFSINPTVVMLSYINFLKIEISNIINIVEGIRYGLSNDEIRKSLILKERSS